MLHEFLTDHRDQLVAECTRRVARRYAPAPLPSLVAHGVPSFIDQLIEVLAAEQATALRAPYRPRASPVDSAIGRTAAVHGLELLRLGYGVDQVVHQYGDLCQAVTGLAEAKNVAISADEYRTLNRTLDEAIADAVSAFTNARETAMFDQAMELHERLGALAEEERRLLDIALQALAAIQTGNLGTSGATGTALMKTLVELRGLIERALPEIRLATGVTDGPADRSGSDRRSATHER